MKIYTSKQIDKILGEINFLQMELDQKCYNTISGEGLSKAIEKILTVILEGEEISLSIEK